jgi:DNA-binding MarR family transcriptional regulator
MKPATVAALNTLFDETVALFHRLRAAAEQVHGQGELSAARRGVLRSLDRLGPQTVPQLARARPVSRQHIQMLVNQLAAEGHVELADNPAHQRSRLVRLTRQGKSLVEAMNHREQKLLAGLETGIPDGKLRAAATVLRAVRQQFESDRWRRLIEKTS